MYSIFVPISIHFLPLLMLSLLAVCLRWHSQTLGSFSVNIFVFLPFKNGSLKATLFYKCLFSFFVKVSYFLRLLQYTFYLLLLAASLASINLFWRLVDAF
uniref:Uncharacterized protein n=1 Tax=Ixodes ricinus TaxID=34613 RepID=A0A6B0UER9_IXORI